MRNQKQNTRLQQARGQLFICGMFGNCASSVLSPRTPPGMPEFAQKAAFVWTANEEEDLGRKSASPSSSSDARSSIASEVSTTSSVEELLAEIKAGNATKGAVSGLVGKLGKDCAATRELVRSSGVTEALIALLVLERQEEALHALAVLAEDEVTARAMATPEFLAVVVAFVSTGRKEARESACILLEKLSLEESFKATMGSSPGVMEALNDLLCDEDHLKLVKVATRTLLALCLLRDNRRRAVEVGAVASLLEMLPRARSATAEKALATLELLGTIEEGKAAIIDHALAVPVLVELILRVSDRGTEYAAGTLSCMCSDSVAMREAAVAHGAPTKLLLLIQSDCTARAKRKASQLLKVLHKLWVQDPCNPDSEGTKAIHY